MSGSESSDDGCSKECCYRRMRDIRDYLIRKRFGVFLFFLTWALTIYVFIIVKDPDWNIFIIPYLLALVACSIVTIFCERGNYNHERLGDIYISRLSREVDINPGLGEAPDTEDSPLLTGPRRNEEAQIPYIRADPRPLEDVHELFEPAPVSHESKEGAGCSQRDTQVTIQADVHRPVQDLSSPKTSSDLPGESSSTASGRGPHKSSTTPGSGVALQSTAQSTPSGSGGPIPRPPSSNPEQTRQDSTSPLEKSTKF